MVVLICGKSNNVDDTCELVIEYTDIKKALKALNKLCLEDKYDYYMIRNERNEE